MNPESHEPDIAFDLQKLFHNVIMDGMGPEDEAGETDNEADTVAATQAASAAALCVSCLAAVSREISGASKKMSDDVVVEPARLEAEVRIMRARLALSHQAETLQSMLRAGQAHAAAMLQQQQPRKEPELKMHQQRIRGDAHHHHDRSQQDLYQRQHYRAARDPAYGTADDQWSPHQQHGQSRRTHHAVLPPLQTAHHPQETPPGVDLRHHHHHHHHLHHQHLHPHHLQQHHRHQQLQPPVHPLLASANCSPAPAPHKPQKQQQHTYRPPPQEKPPVDADADKGQQQQQQQQPFRPAAPPEPLQGGSQAGQAGRGGEDPPNAAEPSRRGDEAPPNHTHPGQPAAGGGGDAPASTPPPPVNAGRGSTLLSEGARPSLPHANGGADAAAPAPSLEEEPRVLTACPDVDIRSDPFKGLDVCERLEAHLIKSTKRGVSPNDVTRMQRYARYHCGQFFWLHEGWKAALQKSETEAQRTAVWHLYSAFVDMPEFSTPLVRAVWERKLPQLSERYMNFRSPAEKDNYVKLIQQWHENNSASQEVLGELYRRAARALQATGGTLVIPELAHLEPTKWGAPADVADRKRPREDDSDLLDDD